MLGRFLFLNGDVGAEFNLRNLWNSTWDSVLSRHDTYINLINKHNIAGKEM
jgi:hypothetical protein